MKKMIIIGLLFCMGCASSTAPPISHSEDVGKDLFSEVTDGAWWVIKTTARGYAVSRDNPCISGYVTTTGPNIGIDTYGYGIHSDRFGRPIRLEPDFGYVPGERLYIQEDAYGFGVHSDQYGRPVREYPLP